MCCCARFLSISLPPLSLSPLLSPLPSLYPKINLQCLSFVASPKSNDVRSINISPQALAAFDDKVGADHVVAGVGGEVDNGGLEVGNFREAAGRDLLEPGARELVQGAALWSPALAIPVIGVEYCSLKCSL